MENNERVRISIIGAGYVGLALAVEFGKLYDVLAYDVSVERVAELNAGIDATGEFNEFELRAASFLRFSADEAHLSGSDFFIITVGTPVFENGRPDMSALVAACETVGRWIRAGNTVVFESTVYPGATEEVCLPILVAQTPLRYKEDFFIAYSPERINPGDKERRLADIVKVVAGDCEATSESVKTLYESVIKAGIHLAPTIKVAEASKVIENTQRDLNIALINELNIIFDRLDINTQDVMDAASSKWNFMRFKPGLVGGHCISVDPYYLLYKAESAGYIPTLIHAGRRVNEHMSIFAVNKLERRLKPPAKLLLLGFTFKENCKDIRNTKVYDLYQELKSRGYRTSVYDCEVNVDIVRKEYHVEFASELDLFDCDAVVYCVNHAAHLEIIKNAKKKILERELMIYDITGSLKSVFEKDHSEFFSW